MISPAIYRKGVANKYQSAAGGNGEISVA